MATKLYKGHVCLNKDDSNSGLMWVQVYGEEIPESCLALPLPLSIKYNINTNTNKSLNITTIRPVVYTSPHYSPYLGGMFAIPNPGCEIIIAYDESRPPSRCT